MNVVNTKQFDTPSEMKNYCYICQVDVYFDNL